MQAAVLLLDAATLLMQAAVLLLDVATLLKLAAVLLLDVLLLAVLQLDATKKRRKVVPNCLWMLS